MLVLSKVQYLRNSEETATEYLQWLEETPLEALDPNEAHHRHKSVPLLLQRSFEQVGEDARAILALGGQLALKPFAQNIVSEALQLSAGAMKNSFQELTGYGLILCSGERYELSHALIYTYARERLSVDSEVIGRLTAWYTAFAKAESAKGLDGYHRLNEERAHLLRLLDGCVKRKEWEAAKSLAWAIENYLDVQGYWSERIAVNETGLEASRLLDNQEEEGAWLSNLGSACSDLGQIEKAIGYYEQALVIAREIGDRRAEGVHMGNLGNAYSNLGQVEKAVECYDQALVIAKEIGDRRNEGVWQGNLGLAYSNFGQIDKAIGFYERALEIANEIGDRQTEGNLLGNLGLACGSLGQVDKAIWLCERALEIAREIGDRQGEGNHTGNLGNVYSLLGQVEKAIEFYEKALVISKEIGDRRGEGNRLGNLSLVYSTLGQTEKAIKHCERALVIAKEIGDRQGEAVYSWNLGKTYEDTDPARAVELMSICVEFERELGHPDAEPDAKRVAEIKAKITD
ncbi:MAG: tetratricopeptide repeat protein [Gammaproteobacteria bacterium]|nr:tetratricopeptide repeat protein [Gammaproteobacteria bacterium]